MYKFKNLIFEIIYAAVVFFFFCSLSLSASNSAVLAICLFILHLIVRKLYKFLSRFFIKPTQDNTLHLHE